MSKRHSRNLLVFVNLAGYLRKIGGHISGKYSDFPTKYLKVEK